MSSGDYKIFQAQILNKDPVNPRQYTVMQIPDGYRLNQVQLPAALKDQSAPLLNSIVLVLQLDSYRSYILSVLREPFDFLSANQQFRGAIPSSGDTDEDISLGANPVQPGEVFFEATGPYSPDNQDTPGFGAHLYLGNNGSAEIGSGSMAERLVIGGTGSDDDHEVVLSADNGFFESNPKLGTFLQTSVNFDDLNNLFVGNQFALPGVDTAVSLAGMTVDSLGNLEVFTTATGTGLKTGSIVMDISGGVSISSGVAGVPKATIALNSIGTVQFNAASGTMGVARLNDLTTSTTAVDPQYWLWVSAIQAFFTAISGFAGGSPVVQSQLGSLGLAFLALAPTAPPSLISKISTSSLTVTAGN